MQESRFANRMQGIKGNAIRELLKVSQQPGMISLAGGLPSPDTFDIDTISEIVTDVLKDNGKNILQYGSTEGYQPLREELIKFLNLRGFNIKGENLLILSGSQQGINLAGKVMLNPGDKVAVESPSYLAALQIFKTYQVEFVVIPSDKDGMDIDVLEQKLETEKPKVVYIVPTFQNPSSSTLTLERRKRVVELLKKHETLLIEDDPYGYLRYSGEVVPFMTSMDTTGQSIYLGSFSKIISPGLRVGYVVGPADVITKMRIAKQGTDVHTSMLSQAIVAEFFKRGIIVPHIEKIKEQYKAKRDLCLAEMAKHFPKEAKYNVPDGGLFIWVTLPESVNTEELFHMGIKEKVAFVPGETFFVDGRKNCLRLNFSNASHENIVIGIKRLGNAMKKFLGK
ncbi:PLP-dependent aminotransferase family protein [Clostridium sp. 'deep sea']|uniref:aminotransferase-like domain-containing protein n=1 Tax=Clostridium sp. 'deep sea' TaxID=2779445 RepID=UPI0018965DA2|nr:PLP-dependent aminotransferase family protein [Clostridium sp. 'deep sea']QOR35560.1 PLP-dependent aminotransferase family protein [Clostridium sp. 'deep sea']